MQWERTPLSWIRKMTWSFNQSPMKKEVAVNAEPVPV